MLNNSGGVLSANVTSGTNLNGLGITDTTIKLRANLATTVHMKGKAIDVRLTDVETLLLRETALALKRGGVGYYRESDFVHLDTGRVRQWSG